MKMKMKIKWGKIKSEHRNVVPLYLSCFSLFLLSIVGGQIRSEPIRPDQTRPDPTIGLESKEDMSHTLYTGAL